jgi:glycosyltransferase involved in cell wall biosynthesis
MASGRPILALRKGGALDTVVEGQTGLFFDEQSADALVDGVARFEAWLPDFDPEAAVRRAARFSPGAFDSGILRSLV